MLFRWKIDSVTTMSCTRESDPPVTLQVTRFDEPEGLPTWILDDEEGHRIPNPDHPQGRWPGVESALDVLRDWTE